MSNTDIYFALPSPFYILKITFFIHTLSIILFNMLSEIFLFEFCHLVEPIPGYLTSTSGHAHYSPPGVSTS